MHPCNSISSRPRSGESVASLAHPVLPFPCCDLYFSALLYSGSALIPQQSFEPEEKSKEIAACFAFIYSHGAARKGLVEKGAFNRL